MIKTVNLKNVFVITTLNRKRDAFNKIVYMTLEYGIVQLCVIKTTRIILHNNVMTEVYFYYY